MKLATTTPRFAGFAPAAALAVAVVAAALPAAAQTAPEITPEMEAIAERRAAAGPQALPDPADTEPTETEGGPELDSTHPFFELKAARHRLVCLATPAEATGDCDDTIAEADRPKFAAALAEAETGYDAFSRMEPDPRGAARSLAKAVKRLPRDTPLQPIAAELATSIATGVRRMGERMLDRATAAGVDTRLLDVAQAKLEKGDAYLGEGKAVQATKFFGKPLKLANNLVFDVEQFETNIVNSFQPQTIGYAYAINRNGLLVADDGAGSARMTGEANPTSHGSRKRQNIASVTKNLTAVAALKLLEQDGIDPEETSVSDYLPPDWTKGPGLANLTFHNLLRHETGLDGNTSQSGSNFGVTLVYSGLQTTIQNGVTASKTYIYQNVNFALFRVIIPTLFWDGNPIDLQPDSVLGDDNDDLTSLLYEYYIQEFVLEPSGIALLDSNQEWASTSRDTDTMTRYYFFPNASGNVSGTDFGDWARISGGGGWHLSAYDLAAYMAHVRYDDALLSPAMRSLMDKNFYGYNDPSSSNFNATFALGKFGVYRGHGGDLGNGGTPTKGLDSCIMNFPSGVQAVVLTSSVGGSYPYQCVALKNAYDNAWVKK